MASLIAVEVHTALDVSPLAAVWAQAAQPRPASCFQSFRFAHSWTEIYGPQAQLKIFHSPAPAMVLPLVIANHQLAVLGHGLFDYADLIAAPAAAAAARDQAPEIAASALSWPGWRRLEVCAVPGDSPFLEFWRALAAAIAAPGPAPGFTRYSAAPRLLAAGGKPNRGAAAELDRLHGRAATRLRRAQRAGWLGPVQDLSRRSHLLRWMVAQKENRLRLLGQQSVLQGPEAAWLEKLVTGHPETAELWAYCRQEQPWAGFLTFLTPAVRYGYLLAFDPARERESPAIELLYFVLRRTVAEGREFDFLTGEQAYKLRFANAARPLLRLEVQRPAAR